MDEIPKIAEFEKVSFEQFVKDSHKCGFDYSYKENSEQIYRELYDRIQLPTRQTSGSAGYDFASPYALSFGPSDSYMIPSGIRCKIAEGYVLLIYVRSSIGVKRGFVLSNGTGVIDSDYYNADNEGHIMLPMRNMNRIYQSINANERIAQGIFVPFGITVADEADGTRTGGLGSTGV